MSTAIIGSGYSGLHLALRLQAAGREVVLYSDRTPEQFLSSRLTNTACHWATTRQRDTELDVNHWTDPESAIHRLRVMLGLPEPVRFECKLSGPGYVIDHRLYQATLLEDFIARGGRVQYDAVDAEGVSELSTQHDLVAVATGKGGLADLFDRVEDHCPWSTPQRKIASGFYHGYRLPEPTGVRVHFAPGIGELFEYPIVTMGGATNAVLFFFAVPGSPLEAISRTTYVDDPESFNGLVKSMLDQFFPDAASSVDVTSFGLTRAEDLVQGAITPTLRRAFTRLPNRRFVVAMGDVHSVNDPIMGQGSNAAVRSAAILADLIEEDDLAVDEWFCSRYERRAFEFHEAVQGWNNLMLHVPPRDHVVEFLLAASQNERLANAFGDMFDRPTDAWSVFSSPERTSAFIAEHAHALTTRN